MTWVKYHKCDPYPDSEGLKNGDEFECDGCGKHIQYRYDPTPVSTPMARYKGFQWWVTVKEAQ